MNRIQQVLKIAEKLKRKVFFNGRSMLNNLEISLKSEIIKGFEEIIKPIQDLKKYEDSKVIILGTGSQGEEISTLSQISENKHKNIKIKKTDLVILSSSVIPGNELSVNKLINNFYKNEIKVITNKDYEIHSSGHANEEEIKELICAVKPKFFFPVHGESMHLHTNKAIGTKVGIKKNHSFILENGRKIELFEDFAKKGEMIKIKKVYITNNNINDIKEVTLKERKELSNRGIIFVCISNLHNNTRVLIEQCGFDHESESRRFFGILSKYIQRVIEKKKEILLKEESKIKNYLKREIEKEFKRNKKVVPIIKLLIK